MGGYAASEFDQPRQRIKEKTNEKIKNITFKKQNKNSEPVAHFTFLVDSFALIAPTNAVKLDWKSNAIVFPISKIVDSSTAIVTTSILWEFIWIE